MFYLFVSYVHKRMKEEERELSRRKLISTIKTLFYDQFLPPPPFFPNIRGSTVDPRVNFSETTNLYEALGKVQFVVFEKFTSGSYIKL